MIRFLLLAMTLALVSAADAHTLMHLSLYDIKREVVLTDNIMVTRHHCTLRKDDLDSSNPLFGAVDTDLDSTASLKEIDALNQAAADYLITDFIVFVDKDMLASTTETVTMFPNQEGFQADVRTELSQIALPETTVTVTIIDPAYLFPPTDPDRSQPPTPIQSNGENLVSKDGNAVNKIEVDTSAASYFNWKPVPSRP